MNDDEVLARVSASMGRRILGVTSVGLLGLFLIYIAFTRPPAFGWQIFLLAFGGASLWLADLMRRATAEVIELTETELRDTSGTVIARMDDISGIDRGFFAFKPSNGFLLKTKKPGPRAWRPGLWWRAGRRIGVGGMTPGSQSKAMSEIIAIKLAQREMEQG